MFRSLLAISLIALITACQSSPTRMPSSLADSQTMQSIAPTRYEMAPDWKVSLHNGEKNGWKVGDLSLTTYKIGTPEGLRDFEARLEEIKKEDKALKEQKKEEKKAKKLSKTDDGDDDKSDKHGKKKKKKKKEIGFLDKGSKLCVELMLGLVDKLKTKNLSERERNETLWQIAEISASFNYDFAYPIRGHYWIAEVPFEILATMHHGTMTDKARESIDVVSPVPGADLSLVDPPASSFWHPPGEISKKNLYVGFDRDAVMRFPDVCKYKGPKTNYGTHGGFKFSCGDEQFRIKFGDEAKKEPFISRITWALGYYAKSVDYVKGLKVAYDRRLFSEFNSRKELDLELRSLLGFDYARIHLQKYREPFEVAVAGAVLKDGKKISSSELRAKLLKVREDHAEQNDKNYNDDFEKKIDYLIMNEGNVVAEADKHADDLLGPWSYNDFDRADRRAYRGFGIYSGFLNMFDARMNNNVLLAHETDNGGIELRHMVSDLGSGLGKGTSVFTPDNGNPNYFGWDYMRVRETNEAYSVGQDDPLEGKIEIIQFAPLESNKPFKRAQLSDARWMARKLAQITESQFSDALVASGYDASEVRLYLEKLLSRRSSMMKALNLDREFPEPRAFNRELNYDPTTEAVPFALVKSTHVLPPVGNQRIVHGRLEPRN